jgi:RHS repeat-associated protein
VIWKWESDPFGAAPANDNPDGDSVKFSYNLRFPGQYYDAETGKHYNYFRDYDPGTGRYVESDPIGLDGGLNTYTYVGQNPLVGLDPYGLTQQDIILMTQLASVTQQDLRDPGDITVRDLGKNIYGGEIAGRTTFFTKNIILDDRWLENLSCDQLKDLFETIVHEMIHRTRSRLDMMFRPVTHSDIYLDASYRTYVLEKEIREHCSCALSE